MKVYIILKEDHGYLGYGRDIGNGAIIESVHKTYDDAYKYIIENYRNTIESSFFPDNGLIEVLRYFADGMDDHVYEFHIYEKELA